MPTAVPSFNEWLLSLPEGRRNVLREDKWMLASAAWEAAIKLMEERYAQNNG